MADESAVKEGTGISEKAVINEANRNGIENGTESDVGIVVENRYTGRLIRLTNSAIRHSLGRANRSAATANARATAKAGELLNNAVPVNALKNTSSVADGTYAMVGYLVDNNGATEHVAVLTVEQRSGDVIGFDVYDTLHALSTRKRNAVVPPNQITSADEQHSTSTTRSSAISIADLLSIVNETHQSLLSEDALAHFNSQRNPEGYYTGRVKYSQRRKTAPSFRQTMLEMEPTEDMTALEKELLTKYKGYTDYHT